MGFLRMGGERGVTEAFFSRTAFAFEPFVRGNGRKGVI
jgi:hypothetical protein